MRKIQQANVPIECTQWESGILAFSTQPKLQREFIKTINRQNHNVAIAKKISDNNEPNLPNVKPSWWKWCNLMINYGTDNGVERSTTPSAAAARVINTADFAGPIMDACTNTHESAAAIFSVDFWSEGNLPTLIDQRNAQLGVDATATPSASPVNVQQSNPTQAPNLDSSAASTSCWGMVVSRRLHAVAAVLVLAALC